jgi:hypothetical protein
MDAVKAEIESCWLLPSSVTGASDAAGLVVEVQVHLDPAANVMNAVPVDNGAMANPIYAAAARSIMVAVRKCSPLESLPRDRFAVWQQMTLRFNLKEYLGL